MQDPGEFTPDAPGAGRRALRNAVLDLLAAEPHRRPSGPRRGPRRGGDQHDRLHRRPERPDADERHPGRRRGLRPGSGRLLRALEGRALVVDKWFALQARSPAPDALAKVAALTTHPAFEGKNPNRIRALVASFASGNPARFHDPSGAGYRFLADQILLIDGFNPMIAARLLEAAGRLAPVQRRPRKAHAGRIVAHRHDPEYLEERPGIGRESPWLIKLPSTFGKG